MKSDDEKKTGKVLGSYRKVGTKFVPPLLQAFNFDYISWTTQTMPELVWWDVLIDQASHRLAAAAAEEIATFFKGKGVRNHWWAFASDYSNLSDEEASELSSHLSRVNVLSEMEAGLSDFLYLYPCCPISKLFSASRSSLSDPEYLLHFEARLEELEDKRSRSGVLVQAQVIYMAFISGRLHVRADLALADFPEVENYPNTEKAVQVGASICAAVNMLGSEVPKYRDNPWVQYFWRRSLELHPLDFSHLDGI